MGAPYTFPVTASHDRRAMTTDEGPDPAVVMFDALGYAVRELAKAHELLDAIVGGLELESLAGAVLEARTRVEHVYRVAAELRGRYS